LVVGNAATATALASARNIGGTSFNGTSDIAVALSTTATALASARTIGGVSFNGSANINLPGVNISGNQDTSGNAATATTVADNAITLAKMAGLVRGKIICGDSDGNPVALTAGNDTQVLTSDGTDISWANAAGGSDTNYYLNDITKSGNTLTFVMINKSDETFTFGSNAFNSTTIPTNNNQLSNGAGYTTNTGDITGVTAGVGLSGGGTSGAVTLTVDISEFSAVTPANGDKLLTLDSNGSTEQLTTVASLATLFAGTGLTASASIINLDFSELTDMTGDISGTTEFILQNSNIESRKAASEIKLSNFNNDLLIATEPHHILESLPHICDGHTWTNLSGSRSNIQIQNVTGVQYLSNAYADVLGSSITYVPPSGTTLVEYEYYFYYGFVYGTSNPYPHISMKFFIAGQEVTNSRASYGGQTDLGGNNVSFKWVMEIGDGNDAANGKFSSWTSGKTLKLTARERSSSNYQVQLNYIGMFANSSGDDYQTNANLLSKPVIKITAFGTKSILSGLSLTNATDNRVLTSTGGTGLNAEANLTFDGNTLRNLATPSSLVVGVGAIYGQNISPGQNMIRRTGSASNSANNWAELMGTSTWNGPTADTFETNGIFIYHLSIDGVYTNSTTAYLTVKVQFTNTASGTSYFFPTENVNSTDTYHKRIYYYLHSRLAAWHMSYCNNIMPIPAGTYSVKVWWRPTQTMYWNASYGQIRFTIN